LMAVFRWRHFAGEIILWAVRWYCRYGISYRELEEMVGERGVTVDPHDVVPVDAALCAGAREAFGLVSQPVVVLLAGRRDLHAGQGAPRHCQSPTCGRTRAE
jgi:hypothetical protein